MSKDKTKVTQQEAATILDSWNSISWTYGMFLVKFEFIVKGILSVPFDDMFRNEELYPSHMKSIKNINVNVTKLGSRKEAIESRNGIISYAQMLVDKQIVLHGYERKVIDEALKIFHKIYDRELELISKGEKYSD